jgi:SAM-dependent methyltransferase
LAPKLCALGYKGIDDFFVQNILEVARQRKSAIKIISIGSGNCDTEIRIANSLLQQGWKDFCINCIDINEDMLERGEKQADQQSLKALLTFTKHDINKVNLVDHCDVVLASHSLHHILNLEHLFDQIHDQLVNDGLFLINDMIGRNGHMRWPEAEVFVQGFWALLEEKHKYNHQLSRLDPIL